MRCLILAFVAGTSYLQTWADLPGYAVIALMFCLALITVFCSRFMQSRALKFSLLLAAGFFFGMAWAAGFACSYLRYELPAELEGRDLTVVGTIASLPTRSADALRFNFAVERVLAGPPDLPAPQLPSRLALSWYGQPAGDVVKDGAVPPALNPGERWQLTVRLRRPHGTANPHGFDYEAWLLEQKLRATGSVRREGGSQYANRRLDSFVFSLPNLVERLRSMLRAHMQAGLDGLPYAGILVALVVGDQRDISAADWKVFTRAGISHLVSISGLHITMVAGLFAGLLQALWRRSFFTALELPLLLPAQKVAALAGALTALLYVALSGFGVPAQRTLVMLAVVAHALWSGRISSISHVLCWALALVLLFDPWAVLWPGFWLSFGAVAVIVYATAGRAGAPGRLVAGHPVGFAGIGDGLPAQAAQSETAVPYQPGPAMAMRYGMAVCKGHVLRWRQVVAPAFASQYAVTLGMVPLTLLLFGQFSVISPLANAIAIPLVSFLVTPLALAGSMLPAPLSPLLLGAAHALLAWLAALLAWLSSLPFAVWRAPVPDWPVFLLALAGTLWMLAPAGWPQRWLGLLLWLPLLLSPPSAPAGPGRLRVLAFDVGQGAAVLLETRHHRLLYDTGPAYSADSDGGNRVILPYLRARGIATLDMLVVSHSDADHAGGALSVLDEVQVGEVISSLAPDSAIVQRAPLHRACLAGRRWRWDGVLFEVLYPDAARLLNQKLRPNGRSCTLKVSAGADSILLAGDIEAPQEAVLLSTAPLALPSTVLLAPHHGSGTSSTREFLQAVSPRLALFQVGYRNRYRHPQAAVYARYAELGISRLRSDDSGAIGLELGQGLEYETYRQAEGRYWFTRPALPPRRD